MINQQTNNIQEKQYRNFELRLALLNLIIIMITSFGITYINSIIIRIALAIIIMDSFYVLACVIQDLIRKVL